MNIYVGNLPYSVEDDELRETFEEFGTVKSAEVIFDRRTKRSRGYGFVEMDNEQEGHDAIEALNGSALHGRELRVDESKPKSEKQNGNGQRRNNRSNKRSGNSNQQPADTNNTDGGGIFGFVKRIFG